MVRIDVTAPLLHRDRERVRRCPALRFVPLPLGAGVDHKARQMVLPKRLLVVLPKAFRVPDRRRSSTIELRRERRAASAVATQTSLSARSLLDPGALASTSSSPAPLARQTAQRSEPCPQHRQRSSRLRRIAPSSPQSSHASNALSPRRAFVAPRESSVLSHSAAAGASSCCFVQSARRRAQLSALR